MEENRVFDPPVKQHAQARQACKELGGELANAQCDIVVYSSDRRFIEADVVRGYVSSGEGWWG